MRIAWRTDTGRVREGNEDCVLTDSTLGLLMVADGMGGQKAGEVASRLAVDTVHAALLASPVEAAGDEAAIRTRLESALQAANAEIWQKATSPEWKGMGTTLVLALKVGDVMQIAHVGDSRAYLLRARSLRQLTRDHSLVAEMVEAGELSARDARRHRLRNILTRSLGTEAAVEASFQSLAWGAGDRLLLCSDGLTGMLTDRQIEAILVKRSADLERACEELVKAANAEGGKDNITVILAGED